MNSNDSSCATCASNIFPFFSLSSHLFDSQKEKTIHPSSNSLLSASFTNQNASGLDSVAYLYPTATRYRSQPNCIALAFSNGLRGAAIGSVFGGALALSTAVQSGYRGSSVVTYAGQGAIRNAAAFASWTSMYALTKCGLMRVRGRHDMLNSVLAGGFTGGFLTVVTNRSVWRYNRAMVLSNAAASAMIALVFDVINRF